MSSINENPYRLFFPAGLVLGFWGVALWILFFFGRIAYPGTVHPDVMMGGFLLCFATGFLLTAAPRLTASFPMTKGEAWVFFPLLAAQVAASFVFNKTYFFAAGVLLLASLVLFLVRRFRSRTVRPPDSFMFIGAGLILTIVSLAGLLIDTVSPLPWYLVSCAREYFFQGFILFMVIGVGTKLIPMLTGHAAFDLQAGSVTRSRSLSVLLLAFIATFVAGPVFPREALLVRGVLLAAIFVLYWKILRLPKSRTWQSWGLWVSAWMMGSGVLLSGIYTDYRIHFLHIYFISGLGLLTLMIATRVTLAHGGHGLQLESRSKTLPAVIILILMAAAARAAAGFVHTSYLDHLLYASLIWCAALLLWASVFVKRM